MTASVWIGLAGAIVALIAAGLLTHFLLPGRRLPAFLPLAIGCLIGPVGFGWASLEATGPILPVALALGAGWIAIAASEAAASTFRRSTGKSAITWAAAFAIVGPSCLAGCLAPVVVTVAGPKGLSIPALVIIAAAAIVPHASRFRSVIAASALSHHKQREAMRAGDALMAAALLAWPAYWAAARAFSAGETVTADAVVASIALSFGMGIGMGLAGMFLLRAAKANLVILGIIALIVVTTAVLASSLDISAVGTCFLAGTIMAQEARTREALFAVARNFDSPFRALFLIAAGASASRSTWLLGSAVVFIVVLGGRFLLGLATDAIASAVPNAATGRHFGWAASIPSSLGAAMVAEATVTLASTLDPAAAAGEAAVSLVGWSAGSLSPLPGFLLAIAAGEFLFDRALRSRLHSKNLKW